jgi:site-specific DNA-methyltransferase (adenine-specific)
MKAGQQRRATKGSGGYNGNMPDTTIEKDTYGDSGGASRFFYCAKANKQDRTSGGQVDNTHPTVKPQGLMEYLCRLVTPPTGGHILDPFMGSGSTGIAALNTGNQFVGVELEEESYAIADKRITIAADSIGE